MYILLWLLFGAAVGWIASIVMKSNRRMGLIANIIFWFNWLCFRNVDYGSLRLRIR